jgi:DNA-binding response OmpR family regulator
LLRPDFVLMDVRMPDLDGALQAGASGFLLKHASPEELLAAIHAVAAGESLLSPSVTRIVIERMASQPLADVDSAERLDDLTPREREVLELVARGLLRLRDRIQAVIFAYESGLVRAGPTGA